MIYTQLPTNSNIYVFWNEDMSENTTILEINGDNIDLHQFDSWVSIPRDVFIKMSKLINKK